VAIGGATASPDTLRRPQKVKAEQKRRAKELTRAADWARVVSRSRTMDLTDIARREVFFDGGRDAQGRPVLTFVGSRFHSTPADFNRVLAYFVRVADSTVSRPYVLLYVATGQGSGRHPDVGAALRTYRILPQKYRKNVAQLVVLHPGTFWGTLAKAFARVVSPKSHRKLVVVNSLEQLFATLPRPKIYVPDLCYAFEQVAAVKQKRIQAAQSRSKAPQSGPSRTHALPTAFLPPASPPSGSPTGASAKRGKNGKSVRSSRSKVAPVAPATTGLDLWGQDPTAEAAL
jgi:hypothetical protein